MNKTWWLNKSYISEPVAVKVERHTEQSVWIGGSRNAKKSDYSEYFQTWEEAKRSKVDRAARNVASLQRQLEEANKELERAMELVPPRQSGISATGGEGEG
jgi:hypothetical protein